MNQSLELYVWLGAAGIALSSAQLLLWRTRRVLHRTRQAAPAPVTDLVPAAITQLTSTEMAISVTAP